MTQSSWPFEGADTTETQYSRLLRHIGQGINGVPGDNNLLAYADSTGMNVKVKVSGGTSQAIIRGHMYQSTAEEVLSIAAASTSPRIDAVVLRLDPSANSIVLAVVTGTPSVTPSAPALTQTDTAVYELLLAYVNVSSSATTISAGDITDKRSFIEKVWTTNNRPNAVLGLTGFNTTIGKLETYNGSTWEVITPTALDASVITSGTIDPARLGTLSVNKGGTGSTSAADARTALGITPGNIGAAQTVHTHSISDVTSLQSALDGKQAAGSYASASHTHDASAVISGTLNADRIPNLPVSRINGGTWTGAVSGLANITCNDVVGQGGAQFNFGIKSAGVYNNDLSSQTRKAVWIGANEGALGYAPSTIQSKQDITDSSLTAEAGRALRLVDFRYKKAVSELGDKAPIEIGLIAEELLEIPGMKHFVFFDDEGKPAGIHYELLSLALIPLIQEQSSLLESLEERMSALENL